jgi:hypothetical protein
MRSVPPPGEFESLHAARPQAATSAVAVRTPKERLIIDCIAVTSRGGLIAKEQNLLSIRRAEGPIASTNR